jgi:ribosomal protein S18 acetylase RimI-like enzyme
MDIRCFAIEDTEAVVGLWKQCGLTRPWNDPYKDIERKLGVQPELFLVGLLDGQCVGTAMGGFDGHRGWVYYLAVAPAYQGRGLGRRLMRHLESALESMGCPKLNLQIRGDNEAVVRFYEREGYGRDEVVSLGKRLIADKTR